LVETILSIIPENRVEDVVLFDVSDTEHPVWFNPFSQLSNNSTHQEKNKDLLVSTILSVFKKLYGYSWGPRLEYILRNVLISLSDYPNANFLDKWCMYCSSSSLKSRLWMHRFFKCYYFAMICPTAW
jgi:hypothetical protein